MRTSVGEEARHLTTGLLAMAIGAAAPSTVRAQQAAAGRAGHTPGQGVAHRATQRPGAASKQEAVTNPNLELKVYGACKDSQLGVAGWINVGPFELYGKPVAR